MKLSNTSAVAAAGALSVVLAFSMPVAASDSDEMCAAITFEISQPGVCVSEDDGIVTLTGVVESAMDKEAAERAAMKHEGVKEVRNMISVSN